MLSLVSSGVTSNTVAGRTGVDEAGRGRGEAVTAPSFPQRLFTASQIAVVFMVLL